MGLLVGGVERDQLGPSAAGPQQLAAEQLDALAGLEGPDRVRLVGQQVRLAQGERRLGGRHLVGGERRPRRGLEGEHVDVTS